MKKSLIALAALAATASFAQSSVTLSGNLDFAYANLSGNVKGSTVSSSTVTSSTSLLHIRAVEDLGGGMQAAVQYSFDPRNALNNASLATTTTGAGVNNGINRDEAYVGLQGGFGNIMLGAPNSIGLTTYGVGAPLGTGIGSGYTAVLKYSAVRFDRAARYNSPSFGGLTASVLFAPGNDQPATTTTTTAPNNSKVTELGLAYANGPLTVAFANISQAAQTNASTLLPTNIPAGAAKTSTNILSANYKLGDTTLYAGWNDGDAMARATTTTATKGYRVAARQDIGAIALIASYAEQKSGTANAEKYTGLRADYNLSKTNAVYLAYEKYDTGVAYANSTTTGDRTTVSVGVRKAF